LAEKQQKEYAMSTVIESAVSALNEKMRDGFSGVAKFVIDGEGAIIVDGEGARASDEEASVTLTADADTFESMMAGDLDPTAAFMQGKLAIDGDMGLAMQLGAALS
jgi:putative sterol carrier protein